MMLGACIEELALPSVARWLELALPSVVRWPAGAAAKADIVNPPKADEVRMKRVMLRRFMVTGSMVKPQASDQN